MDGWQFWNKMSGSFHAATGRSDADMAISDEEYPAFHIGSDIDGPCTLCNVPG